LNCRSKSLLLVSINSTPILFSKLIASQINVHVESISLFEFVKDFLTEEECYFGALLDTYNKTYPTQRVYCPISMSEFDIILKQLSHQLDIQVISDNKVVFASESDFLKRSLITYSKMFGNLIDYITVKLTSRSETVVFESGVFYAWSDHHIIEHFHIANIDGSLPLKLIVSLSSRGILRRIDNGKLRLLFLKNGRECLVEEIVHHQGEYCGDWPCGYDECDELCVDFELAFPLFCYNYRDFHNQ